MTETLERMPILHEMDGDFSQYTEEELRDIARAAADRGAGVVRHFGGSLFGGDDNDWGLRYEPSYQPSAYTSGATGVLPGGHDSDHNLTYRRNLAVSAWRIRAQKAYEAHHGVKYIPDSRVAETEKTAQEKLDALWAALEKEAQERSWCAEYDDFAATHGGPPRKTTRNVTLTLTMDVPLTGNLTHNVRRGLREDADFNIIGVEDTAVPF